MSADERVWVAADLVSGFERGRCIADAKRGNFFARQALRAWAADTSPDDLAEVEVLLGPSDDRRREMPESGKWTAADVASSSWHRGAAEAAARAGDRSARAALDEYAAKET